MTSILLGEEQKERLVLLASNAPDLLTKRAKLILAYATGKQTLEAAHEAGISRGRARFWKRQFLARGMDIFASQPESIRIEVTTDSTSENTQKEEASESLFGKVDTKTVEHEEPPYPEPLKQIGINPDDTLAEAGRKVWLYTFAAMLCHEEGTLKGEDIEELHDMRVATRRMRSAFDIFGPAYEEKSIRGYLKGLRAVGRALGQVRDLDVILENGVAYQGKIDEEKQSGLEPLLNHWRQIINSKREELTGHLKSDKYLQFKREFNQFLQVPERNQKAITPQTGMTSRVRDYVPVLVYSRYAAVKSYDSILPNASITQLHQLRIEFKKFRYTLEYFKEILGEGTGQAIREIKRSQDHLGELHDADVACGLIKTYLKVLEKNQAEIFIPQRINPETIVNYMAFMHAERYRLMVTFPDLWSSFSSPQFRQTLAQAISTL